MVCHCGNGQSAAMEIGQVIGGSHGNHGKIKMVPYKGSSKKAGGLISKSDKEDIFIQLIFSAFAILLPRCPHLSSTLLLILMIRILRGFFL